MWWLSQSDMFASATILVEKISDCIALLAMCLMLVNLWTSCVIIAGMGLTHTPPSTMLLLFRLHFVPILAFALVLHGVALSPLVMSSVGSCSQSASIVSNPNLQFAHTRQWWPSLGVCRLLREAARGTRTTESGCKHMSEHTAFTRK